MLAVSGLRLHLCQQINIEVHFSLFRLVYYRCLVYSRCSPYNTYEQTKYFYHLLDISISNNALIKDAYSESRFCFFWVDFHWALKEYSDS